ncbi:MAG: double-strand break repair protein AddB [Hyphomonadaceae bacterium]|nr:double-strand break repair protein AddB [Hyphomonadaceae bacterium]
MGGLFDGPAPRVRTIPASAPFLDTLVGALLAAIPRDDPFALADAIVFLPNRRASAGLVEAFARRLGGAALLPAIRALGDLDDDPDVWGPEPIALDVPPAIQPLRRRFELAQLVRRRDAAEGGVADPVRALAWADELCRLLDAAATVEDVDWSGLDTLVAERDLAQHWRRSADFLKIVATYWPQRLRLDGLCDPAERRGVLLRRLAQTWRDDPPTAPVIIAGSTGSVAATRALMAAVAAAPRGCVVLPGLDTDLDDGAWAQVDPQHPQHALRDTLEALGVARADVASLAGAQTQRADARRRLINEALAPAGATADWRSRLDALGGDALVRAGAAGLQVIEARNEEEEAQVIALLLREALETPERTAALVTPDAGLARRVAGKLARWDVTPQTTIGAPLAEAPHGVLLTLLADLLVDDADPVALLALARHPLVRLDRDAATRAADVAALEREWLRGPRTWGSLASLLERSHGKPGDAVMETLAAGLAPLAAARAQPMDFALLADALADAAERLCTGDGEAGARVLWSGPLGEAAAGVLRDMGECGGDLGALEPVDAPRALALLLAAREAPPPRGGHPRIAILGPLEARLQRRDLMILGGLVEGVWPAPPPEDAFLSRTMRRDLKLPAPEARIGLAAHDFAQLANAVDVVMTRPAMRDGAPTVASRWLWRLETLARASGDAHILAPRADADPRLWVRALDAPRNPVRLRPPQPRPPAAARSKRISFTEVETLIRDPYAVYARRVLGLSVLDPPGMIADARHRGIAIHKAIERFADGDDPAALLTLLEERLAAAGFDAARVRTERARLSASVAAYVVWNRARVAAGVRAHREIRGELSLPGGHVLHGTADRIDRRPGGVAEVVDFKTGQPPTKKQVESGLSPQLTLEAAIAARGGFSRDAHNSMPATPVDALIYWRFGGADPGAARLALDSDVMTAADEALARLEALLDKYDHPGQAYLSKPRVQFIKEWADYDHFARRAEWADAEGQE